eukprot:CAMPEP_0204918738 /NCGR_PEP_ID=MMETSP1397-20131031/16366_1 /ASSEMBLY_ACC=CAM_ASM_000891 /TAXON_ID=49980 /ORGANISM="Climacostomum Climacostomum virens, Strain Stock W-24" /LENGTH=148 /DNA_ID=CAMNT_0052092137 /DNA_START=54 /DNA_END=500 /DNA_ORIENTATION=+
MPSRFSSEETGEPPVSDWVTPERAKAMLQEIQRLRNMNRFTIKYDKKQMEEYCELSEKYSRYRLHEFIKFRTLVDRSNKLAKEASDHLKTIPASLMKADLSKPLPIEINHLRYFPQMVLYMPKTLSDGLKAAENLVEVVEDRKGGSAS